MLQCVAECSLLARGVLLCWKLSRNFGVAQGERVVLSIVPPGDGAAPIGLDPSAGLQSNEQQVEVDATTPAPAPTPKL